jgi:hypothetical protein
MIKSRWIRWVGHVAGIGELRKLYKTFVGKPMGKRQLGKARRRWENNIEWIVRK